jgi:hypothetical protein
LLSIDLVDGILFLAPGFLALKIFYLFGAQRPRSQWEWTTWSLIASLPINGLAAYLVSVNLPGLVASVDAVPQPIEIAIRMAVAAATGGFAAFTWQKVRSSQNEYVDKLRMAVTDSAWDQALEDAQNAKRAVELFLDDGARYRGTLRYGGREDNAAEGWIYLTYPQVFDEAQGRFRAAKATHGYLVHRDRVRRIRVKMTSEEAAAARAEDEG